MAIPGVLFVSVANSARGPIAEGLARKRFGARLRIASAGSRPAKVHPMAVDVMKDLDVDLSTHQAKRIDDVDPAGVDLVVTLCAEEVCPAFLAPVRRLHWPIEDPAGAGKADPRVPPPFEAKREEYLRAHRRAPFRGARLAIEPRLEAIEPMLRTPPGTSIAPAISDDRAALERVLTDANLPLAGLDQAFPHGFALARLAGEIVGAAGVEKWVEHALLRSVVTVPAQRKRHIADALVADRIGWSRANQVATLSLLTTGADRYFERLGFTPIDRATLASQVRGSKELALPECSTAVAMTKTLAERATGEMLDEAVAKELSAHGTLVPPWHKFPDIPRRSIGWRMGSGEWYLWMWRRWWESLGAAARAEYRDRWMPERPPAWQDWLADG